jgi:putative membrane protein
MTIAPLQIYDNIITNKSISSLKGDRSMRKNWQEKHTHLTFYIIGLLFFAWSYINHVDTFGWVLLSAPVVIISAFFVATYKKFTFSTMVYFFGLLWAIVLLIGAKYTYTYNPLFEMLKEMFGHSRNHYDRFGHFAQGFVPVMLYKEFFIRKGFLQRTKALSFILVSLVLAFSAFYELLEFFATVVSNQPQSYILDLQGDMWDTQYDMLYAIIGAITSLWLFGKKHDREIDKMIEKHDQQL